jgi:hypothetical protein
VAYSLPLPATYAREWIVKIRDKERCEPPHVTILRRGKAWRYGLRDGRFLDREPDPRDVPRALVAELEARRALLAAVWDAMYPQQGRSEVSAWTRQSSCL